MRLSQSSIKDLGIYVIDGSLEKEDVCPLAFKLRHSTDKSSRAIDYGLYGETKLIGGSSQGRSTDSMPLKKTGGKYALHKRLDIQLEKARDFLNENNIVIGGNTQVAVSAFVGDVEIRGELDIFPTPVKNNPCCVVDVKFSQDIYNDYFTYKKLQLSSYCWGDLEKININQALTYHYLIRNADWDGLMDEHPERAGLYKLIKSSLVQRNIDSALFYYLVIGYGKPAILKNEQILLHPVEWNSRNESLFHYMVQEAIDRYKSFEASDWKPVKQKMEVCDKCPVRRNGKCELYK